jgi:hypothetical protein
MNRYRQAMVAACAAVMGAGVLWCAPVRLVAAADIPASLTDQEFWDFTEHISEPNGYFQSDNFLSNERGYQVVIPELAKTAKADRVYLGVGPEQNYPYIIALKPKMAIIFDIRRGNLHEQLLYKALFEMSADRAEFLSKLWSRKRPDGLTTKSSARDLMTAYDNVQPTEAAFQANLKSVLDWLTKKHGFKLRPATAAGAQDGDADGIEYVYRTAFYTGGPVLTYRMGGAGGGRGGGNMSTYEDIQSLDDGQGVNRGFLANDDNWNVMKDLETRNMLVPVVGDFGGPSAIRSVGKYLKDHNALVTAFYLSNVEQYLNQDGKEAAFLCNVAALPLDDTSTFIFTGNGRYGGRGGGFGGGGGRGGGGGLNTTFLRPMLPDAKSCAGGGAPIPGTDR